VVYDGESCVFRVWAPEKEKIILKINHPKALEFEMERKAGGYHQFILNEVTPDTRYMFGVNNRIFPDPASHFQPDGVHGSSKIICHKEFRWTDKLWHGIPFEQLVIYELHVGTFTSDGTFDGIIDRLDYLSELGINAIELMPVAQFPGARNWGYDGVYPYAVQASYGGPVALKRLVDACHSKGIAVLLDVVYNHLGPEGNYFQEFGTFFSKKYSTPWGEAINFDGAWSDGVRAFVIDNIQHWFEHYHIDGLRCDAVHEIYDASAVNIWEQAAQRIDTLVKQHGRLFHLVAECDANNPKVVKEIVVGGMGFRAQWLDDFHHAVYNLVDTSPIKRYEGFGTIAQLAKAFDDGFVHTGEFIGIRKKSHGASSAAISPDRFVVFNDNHDQTGNRPNGERLASLFSLSQLKLLCAPSLLSAYVPMLFMGEEYGEQAPFNYFVDHSNSELLAAVRKGRIKEFESFNGKNEPADPGALSTFTESKLRWQHRHTLQGLALTAWYKKLISLRRSIPALQKFGRQYQRTNILANRSLEVVRTVPDGKEMLKCVFNFDNVKVSYRISDEHLTTELILDSNDAEFCIEIVGTEQKVRKFLAGETFWLEPLSVYVFLSQL